MQKMSMNSIDLICRLHSFSRFGINVNIVKLIFFGDINHKL